ncbi:flagellar basal body-associated FliL family protein [Methylocystis iwaonis]|uniref:flagellar basal body-associated FliL family protein n=1 Tax=Methylocystis iwaonis TaxID=2885079 RepID=UPI002E7C162E|nr:flagellar basal body-associated FliL family protein [Methylocystis iwaonis]
MSDTESKTASDTMTVIAITLAMTVVIAIAGAFVGMMLARTPEPLKSPEPPASEAPSGDGKHVSSTQAHGETSSRASARKAGKTALKELAPIVTNLSDGNSSWIRLQVAIVYDPDTLTHPDILISELTGDIVAYLRSLSLRSIEGSAGLRRLNEELSERASIRSEGAVQELVIQSLVVQ